MSPPANSIATNASVARTEKAMPRIALPTHPMSGSTHHYDACCHQTDLVPGSLTVILASYQTGDTRYMDLGSLERLHSVSPPNDIFDLNTTHLQTTSPSSRIGVDFNFAASSQELSSVNPGVSGQRGSVPPSGSAQSSVDPLWLVSHSQAASTRDHDRARPRGQKRMMRRRQEAQSPQGTRSKGASPKNRLVDRRITQLLDSMRAEPLCELSLHHPRPRTPEHPVSLPKS